MNNCVTSVGQYLYSFCLVWIKKVESSFYFLQLQFLCSDTNHDVTDLCLVRASVMLLENIAPNHIASYLVLTFERGTSSLSS